MTGILTGLGIWFAVGVPVALVLGPVLKRARKQLQRVPQPQQAGPLYVNHDRAEPHLGDVAGWQGCPVTYGYAGWYAGHGDDQWIVVGGTGSHATPELHERAQRDAAGLRLLVDGETRRAVQ